MALDFLPMPDSPPKQPESQSDLPTSPTAVPLSSQASHPPAAMSNPTLSGSLPEYLLQLSILQLVTASAPFSHTRTAPVHALAHLAADYIHLLASTAKHAAEHAGRTHVSVWDVGRALQEFGPGSLGELTVEAEAGRRRRRLGRGAEEVEAEGAGVGDVEVEVDAAERIGELAKGMSGKLGAGLIGSGWMWELTQDGRGRLAGRAGLPTADSPTFIPATY